MFVENMNRRTAILSIFGSALVLFTGSASFKLWQLCREPEIDYLIKKKKLIAEVAETIIPRTSTPGAKDAQVQDFMIRMIQDCTEVKSQNRFISGLKSLEQYTLKTYKKDYISCLDSERIAVLTHLENNEKTSSFMNRIRHKFLGDSFIHMFKYYTVMGYCTSEVGATMGLAYDYIPGSFEACIPLTSHQKCWATE